MLSLRAVPPSTPESVPVLIVGAGPAGLTASLLLARLGIRSLVVERRPQPSILPRATGVNVRSMEIYRSLGLEVGIDAASMPTAGVPFVLVGETLSAPPKASIESKQYEPPTAARWPSPTYARWCAQDELEGVLLDALRREASANVRFGAELVSFDAGAVVTARVRDVGRGEIRTVVADYLLAADGANSGVRDSLGIAMHGQAGLSNQLSILFRADLDKHLAGRRFCLHRIENDTVTGVMRPAGRSGRWLFGTPGAGAPPAGYAELVRAAVGVPDLEVDIIATGAWQASAQVAERFRSGPVFLVGDAAHQHTPGGGFGMNAAIAGAHNLAWKLAAALGGWADPAVLDSYENERRPLAEQTTALSVGMLQAGGQDSARTLGVVLGAHYSDGVLVRDGSPPPPVNDPIADYQPCARPGHRAPHVWLDQGRTRSTVDLFATDLVVCTPDPPRWNAAVGHEVTSGIPIRAERLTTEAAQTYGINPGGAVLVRPDGYVAARWANKPDDPTTELATTLKTLLQQ